MAPSRQVALQEIESGNVLVAGAPALKAARLVAPSESLELRHPRSGQFVSRGGDKLDHALDRFGISVAGRLAIDAGASTGGFTDVLLRRGAARVVAIDVGHGQLHDRLRTDARVEVVDRANVRHLTLADLPTAVPAGIVVADLSFISLRLVAPALLGLGAPDADLVLLVKPQFEAGRAAASKGRGVISDPAGWRDAVLAVRQRFRELGASIVAVVASPVLGAAGNAEFLVHVRPLADATATDDFETKLDAEIDAAIVLRTKAAAPIPAEGR